MFSRLEHLLKIDRFTTKSKLMRARAVYMMGLAFIATQAINFASMYYSYGGFTFDHIVSLIACVLVGLTVVFLRWSDKFQIYAVVYSLLIIAGTMSSALNQNTGINSALIPFFILGVIVNGFICGWRATTAFGALSLVAIWFLWWVSSNYSYTPIFDVEHFADRNFQRAMQASLAAILITMCGAFFSKNMHDAFGDLEAGILAAQNSDRAKTDFLATMSHELFTPMNGIIGMNAVLQESDLDKDQRDLSNIISDSGRDLKTIIGNVLLFSQLESNRVTLDDSPFNMRASLQEILKPYVRAAAEKGLKLKASMYPNVPHIILGDKVRTQQLLSAVLDNAIKFTETGNVELSVSSEHIHNSRCILTIIVTDTGIGIAPEDRSRIFERFTQQDGSIKRRYGGTGLGLTIAEGLAGLMGGSISVDSELNVGSTFTLSLPYETAEPVSEYQLQAAE